MLLNYVCTVSRISAPVMRSPGQRLAASHPAACLHCPPVTQVGDHKASSRTELKTLEPHWNETVAFSPADVADGLAAGRPYVSLRVYDWDLVSGGVEAQAPSGGAMPGGR